MTLYAAEKITHDNTTTDVLTIEPRGIGSQTANFAGAVLGAGATGLTNDPTVYTASVSFDGTPVAIAVTGSTAQTFTLLLDEINTDLGVNGTASIVDGNIKIAAASAGVLVEITDTDLLSSLTGFVDIFSPKNVIIWNNIPERTRNELITMVNTYGGTLPLSPTAGSQTVNFSPAAVGGNATGLASADTAGYQIANFGHGAVGGNDTGYANDSTTYTAVITVDAVGKNISVVGSAAQTYDELIDEINTDLAAAAVAAIVDGNIVVTSATTGTSSTVAIVDGTKEVTPVTTRADSTSDLAGTYFTINSPTTEYYVWFTVDAVGTDPAPVGKTAIGPVDVAEDAADTVVATALQAVIDAHAAFSAPAPVGAVVTITSAVAGVATDATGGDSGFTIGSITQGVDGVFSTLEIFSGLFNAVAGTVGVPFTATVVVDGVTKTVSVTDAEANTFTNLLAAIDTDLGGTAAATIVGDNIVITSVTTPTAVGEVSTVVIRDSNLFSSLAGYASISATAPGVFSFEDALLKNKASNGVRFIEMIGGLDQAVTLKPGTNPRFNPANVVYHDGSVWRFYATDALVA